MRFFYILLGFIVLAIGAMVFYLQRWREAIGLPLTVMIFVGGLVLILAWVARKRSGADSSTLGGARHTGLNSHGRLLSPANGAEVPPGYDYRVVLDTVRDDRAYVIAHGRGRGIYPEVVLPPRTGEALDGWAKVRAGRAGEGFLLLLLEIDRGFVDEVQAWISHPSTDGMELEYVIIDQRKLVLAADA